MKKIILILAMFLLVSINLSVAYSAVIVETTENIQKNIEAVNHVCLIVSDMKKALSFYHDLLGFEVIYDNKQNDPDMKLRNIMLSTPGHFKIELVQFFHPHGKRLEAHSIYAIAYHHIGIKVNDINAVYKILKKHKVQTYNTPTVMNVGNASYSFFFAEDPDKNYIEFYQNLNPASSGFLDM